MTINWIPLFDEDGNTIPPLTPVLLISKYPNSDIWSDPVYGWRDPGADSGYARWHHIFRPTHFACVNTPDWHN